MCAAITSFWATLKQSRWERMEDNRLSHKLDTAYLLTTVLQIAATFAALIGPAYWKHTWGVWLTLGGWAGFVIGAVLRWYVKGVVSSALADRLATGGDWPFLLSGLPGLGVGVLSD